MHVTLTTPPLSKFPIKAPGKCQPGVVEKLGLNGNEGLPQGETACF